MWNILIHPLSLPYHVLIEIIDDGEGFSQEIYPLLREPYVGKSTKNKHKALDTNYKNTDTQCKLCNKPTLYKQIPNIYNWLDYKNYYKNMYMTIAKYYQDNFKK